MNTHLIEQQYEGSLQVGWAAELGVNTGPQKNEQGLQHRAVLEQRLMRLTDQHLKQFQERHLAVGVQASPHMPLHQSFQDVFRHYQLQNRALC